MPGRKWSFVPQNCSDSLKRAVSEQIPWQPEVQNRLLGDRVLAEYKDQGRCRKPCLLLTPVDSVFFIRDVSRHQRQEE